MAIILNIDTSTSVCSVALAKNGKMIALKENNEGLNHSILLGAFVDELLQENQFDLSQIDAVAVSMGPGSYTGLRIGVSLAKGLCFGSGKPLLAIPTLQALASSVIETYQEEALYCPMIDARRMEVYTACYDANQQIILDTQAKIIDESAFADLLDQHKIFFFGNGSDKVKACLSHPNAHFVANIETSAAHMIPLAENLFNQQQFVDVAYFEPCYLKDFIATTPKKKVI